MGRLLDENLGLVGPTVRDLLCEISEVSGVDMEHFCDQPVHLFLWNALYPDGADAKQVPISARMVRSLTPLRPSQLGRRCAEITDEAVHQLLLEVCALGGLQYGACDGLRVHTLLSRCLKQRRSRR